MMDMRRWLLPEHIEAFRAEHPDGIVITHPECRYETCVLADHVGSTDFIIRTVNETDHVAVLLVEQNARIALELSSHAYVLEVGRVAVQGPSANLQNQESVRRSYLGY